MVILSNNSMQNCNKHYPQKGARVIYHNYGVKENRPFPSMVERASVIMQGIIRAGNSKYEFLSHPTGLLLILFILSLIKVMGSEIIQNIKGSS